jgi:DNA-binding winged helix-turn-helix (wHTH) protein
MSASDDRLRPELSRKLRFGSYEVDLRNRELRKRGLRVKLQEKPFQILEMLLLARGRMVTRRELADHLWPGLHVSFDQSLNTAMNALRQALGDTSKSSRYIETRSGLGYCFTGAVEEIAEARSSSRVPSPSFQEAHHDYLRGRHFCERMNEPDLRKGIAHFEAALKQDPKQALAHSGLADAYMSLVSLNVVPPGELAPKIRSLIGTALSLGADSAEPHLSCAVFRRNFLWDWKGAEVELRTALEIDPDNCGPHRELAYHYCTRGDFEKALSSMTHARELSPLSLSSNVGLAWVLYLTRDFKGAWEQSWKTLMLEPTFAVAQFTLALASQQLGVLDDAIAEFENARQCWDGNPATVAALVQVYVAAGQAEEAERMYRELEQLARMRYVPPCCFVLACLASGRGDLAFTHLEKAVEIRDLGLIWIAVDPRFQDMKGDARFSSMLGAVVPNNIQSFEAGRQA